MFMAYFRPVNDHVTSLGLKMILNCFWYVNEMQDHFMSGYEILWLF